MNGGQFHSSLTHASAAPARTGIDRRGEGERPQDLVQRPGSTSRAVARAELPIVGEAERHDAGRSAAVRHGTDGPDPDPAQVAAPGSATGDRSGIEA